MSSDRDATLRGAWVTAGYLGGGLLLAMAPGFGVSALPLPVPRLVKHVVAGVLVLAVLALVGAAWGRALARFAGPEARPRLTWAGGLSFGPAVLAVAIGLATVEPASVARGSTLGVPIHYVFTVLFVPAVFLVVAVGGLAVGLALRSTRLALTLALRAGMAGALAFLAVDLLMDAVGWRIGAPGAAKRATMVTVTMLGSLGAALAGGAVIGRLVPHHGAQTGGATRHEATP